MAQRREISVLRSLRQLGSTTSALAGKSQCPLIVLRPDSNLGRAGAGVVVSIEDPIGDQSALRVAFEEATMRGTRLTVLSMPTQLAPELGSVVSHDHDPSQAVALYARQFPNVLVRHFVLDPPTIDGMVTNSTGAELLIVGRGRTTNGRSPSLSSVARECVNTAICPVMIVGPGQVGLMRELVSTP